MSDFALEFGQKFTVGDTEFEVVSIASNENTGETSFEVMTVADADKRRERNRPEPEETVASEETPADSTDEVVPGYQPPVEQTMLVR